MSLYIDMAVNDLLSKLQTINNSNLVEVFVPSQGRVVKFRQLSVKQQKDLIKTGLDGALAGATINNVFNEIIEANSTENITFNVFDKAPIITTLRVHAFGGEYLDGESKLDLSKISAKTLEFVETTPACIQHEDIVTINVSVPTLKRDTAVNNAIVAKFKNQQDAAVGDAVGFMYLHELVKFIDSVAVGSDVVDFTTSTIKDCLQVVENLPAKLLTDIVHFIQQFRDQEAQYLTVDDVSVALDARMFAR